MTAASDTAITPRPSCTRLARPRITWWPEKVREVDYRTLRRRVDRVIRQLNHRVRIPVPFDLDVFLDRLEADRGRPIYLVPFVRRSNSSTCGLWVARAEDDIVYHEEATSPLHQDHIILHEVGHMVCEHSGTGALPGELAEALVGTLPRSVIDTVMGRSIYSSQEEQEAELFASLLLRRAGRSTAPEQQVLDPAVADVIVRVESAFGAAKTRRGWDAS